MMGAVASGRSSTGSESVSWDAGSPSAFVARVVSDAAPAAYSISAATTTQARSEETDAALSFSSGWWQRLSGSGASAMLASTAGSSVQVTFEGSAVRVVAAVGPSRGKAQVSVDGVDYGTVDLCASSWALQEVVFSADVGPGQHVLTVSHTGLKNELSNSTTVEVDAVEVLRSVVLS